MIFAHALGQNFTYHDFNLTLNITSVKESTFYWCLLEKSQLR